MINAQQPPDPSAIIQPDATSSSPEEFFKSAALNILVHAQHIPDHEQALRWAVNRAHLITEYFYGYSISPAEHPANLSTDYIPLERPIN